MSFQSRISWHEHILPDSDDFRVGDVQQPPFVGLRGFAVTVKFIRWIWIINRCSVTISIYM